MDVIPGGCSAHKQSGDRSRLYIYNVDIVECEVERTRLNGGAKQRCARQHVESPGFLNIVFAPGFHPSPPAIGSYNTLTLITTKDKPAGDAGKVDMLQFDIGVPVFIHTKIVPTMRLSRPLVYCQQ